MKDASLDEALSMELAGDDPTPGPGARTSWTHGAVAPTTAQRTLAAPVTIEGVGLHSGAAVTMTLRPGAPGRGLWVRRLDVTGRNPMIPARWDHVTDTRLCTMLGNTEGVTVSTVEHLMAALAGLGVDNLDIEVDGPELPVMDGSSAAFVTAILKVGTVAQPAVRQAIRVLDEITVEDGQTWLALRPARRGLTIEAEIQFDSPVIGHQHHAITVSPDSFRADLADCRTFGFAHEVAFLRANGLAQGGSLDNAVVIDGDRVLNPEGLRRPDEFVRHKALDALGDLALAGHPIIGVYAGLRPSHRANNLLLRALFARPAAWRLEPALSTAADITDGVQEARRRA
ncbi:UDP-3-O-acyl-N-acetylglucosamine deacetylase [Roseospira visakhapatnamensis]|uniref:UDP-3-O-acyl-N-acetylglucosamine deacetylase n=1 Tax=Roseospira visakhapatnamensis TaxID=390880 RepID=A0A7W6RFK0_9PROT|nr:UDP-3-O-acyl-N-acetylglucosamine deacetylase [Roseospira visakhapatnamensis]MBB4267502.1 UDP-3-O-[3-hydroxymyristoyl] N-acetylglucosamine deacetylase [Roseospira visakhapatnamensis]